ncbi:hypothetical protein SVIO_058810 [Streptomyces violaceusniger]|uniref:Uncharacterized protein n=1 Tax=Streptomyces violaceusniger TaxID=68280 RepID=A0A4D4L9S2_STRVO|nr:hypothetical protein SVIO_058810 [Streptomyces violaceusniger]
MWRGSVTPPVVGPSSWASDSGSRYGFAAAYLLMDPACPMGLPSASTVWFGARESERDRRTCATAIWHGTGTVTIKRSGLRTRPRSLTWAFVVERVTGIEPAL